MPVSLMPSAPPAAVAVLLCTHNGARFLAQQLDSIAAQQGLVVRCYVSDDGSTDATAAILAEYRASWASGRLEVVAGPRRGYVANFLSLICSPAIDADFVAYADQDDIWDPDKLSRATAALALVPADKPALYCGRTRLVSEAGDLLGYSPRFARPPGFANALVQNIGGGNTMVLNRCARDLLLAAGEVDVVSHDWWTYLLVAGAGGTVIYDPDPAVSYRQHRLNQIGSNMGLRDRFSRAWEALGGRNREWNTRNINALLQSKSLLVDENRRVLDILRRARDAGLVARMLGVRASGIYAQSFAGNLSLFAATLLKKI